MSVLAHHRSIVPTASQTPALLFDAVSFEWDDGALALRGLSGAFPPPLNYAVGLAAFQLFFVPTGVMYWLASRTVARDMADTHAALATYADHETAIRAPRP